MKIKKYGTAMKVKELIEELKKLPSNFPIYIRSKYYGEMTGFEDVPLNPNGICEMQPKDGPKNVTFLI
jgi:hypothetical protein